MIHLEVVVPDMDELLGVEPNGYGTGALLRWETSATMTGTYVEGGTVPLVAGQSVYDVWDPTGDATTWYRTRISNAGGSTFSPYSISFLAAEQGLYLSATQVQAFGIGTELTEEPLLILLDAATQAIRRVAGPMGQIVEALTTHGPLLMVSRPILQVVSVIETTWGTDLTLDPLDYTLEPDQILRRLRSGPNPAYSWRGRVSVTYLPRSDLAERQRVQLALVKLDLTYSPGLASQTIGTWSESYIEPAPGTTYADERQMILGSLGSTVDIR